VSLFSSVVPPALDSLLSRAAIKLGKELPSEELTKYTAALQSNWFDCDTLSDLSTADCISLGVPRGLVLAAQGLHALDSDSDNPVSDLPVSKQISEFGDINTRAPFRTKQFGSSKQVRLTTRRTLKPYRLSADQETEATATELEQFERFLTVRFLGQQEKRVASVTAKKYVQYARGALGWLHHEQGVPLEQLSFWVLFPDASRGSVALVFEHMQWLQTVRNASPATETTALRALIAVAKFCFHKESQSDPTEGDKPYADIPLIVEMRKLASEAKGRWKISSAVANEELKWLSWAEYLRCVGVLRDECAGRDASGRLRSLESVAWSVQLYLIFSLLACVPDRQRTIRELEYGKTLLPPKLHSGRDVRGAPGAVGVNSPVGADSSWVIKHTAADYKTGRDYGDRPALQIAPSLSPALEQWYNRWRQELAPSHNFFFSQKNGQPFTGESLYQMFSNAAFRISGMVVDCRSSRLSAGHSF
jgi:hypothetical protein